MIRENLLDVWCCCLDHSSCSFAIWVNIPWTIIRCCGFQNEASAWAHKRVQRKGVPSCGWGTRSLSGSLEVQVEEEASQVYFHCWERVVVAQQRKLETQKIGRLPTRFVNSAQVAENNTWANITSHFWNFHCMNICCRWFTHLLAFAWQTTCFGTKEKGFQGTIMH